MGKLPENVWVAVVWRYATHSLMVGAALWNEARPGAKLRDLVIDHVPKIEWVAAWNYHLWLALYVPLALWLWARNRKAFVQFLWVGGWLSLLRGVCVPLTCLGPVEGPDVNVGMSGAAMWSAWLGIVNPFTALTSDVPHVALTKDMFFSGHVASSMLLWLYCRKEGALGRVAFAAHALVVATVFFAHLHYTIDVVGAWAITIALYAIVERRRLKSLEADLPILTTHRKTQPRDEAGRRRIESTPSLP